MYNRLFAGARRRYSSNASQLKAGDEAIIKIEDMASSGYGFGKVMLDTPRTVFVPLTAPGDTVAVEITNQSKVYYEGKLTKIIESSKSRTKPVCRHFGVCGACDWLHLSYEEQILQKERLLRFNLNKQKVSPKTLNVVPAALTLNYRCKVRFPGDGFSRRKSNEIVPIKECPLLHPKLQEILPVPHEKGEVWGYNEVEDAITQDEARYKVNDKTLAYHPRDFVQSNFSMNRELINLVRTNILDKIDILTKGEPRLLELYAGNGNFTLNIADLFQSVTAVENESSSIDLLKKNLKANKVDNVKVLKKDVLKFMKELKKNTIDREKVKKGQEATGLPKRAGRRFSCILMDPPRGGLAEVSPILAHVDTDMLIYVSCDSESFAKDSKEILASKKWTLEKLNLVDMFPQTRHMEVVGVFCRSK